MSIIRVRLSPEILGEEEPSEMTFSWINLWCMLFICFSKYWISISCCKAFLLCSKCWKALSFSVLSVCRLFQTYQPISEKVANLITSDREEYLLTQPEARMLIWLKDYKKLLRIKLFLHFTTGFRKMLSKQPNNNNNNNNLFTCTAP